MTPKLTNMLKIISEHLTQKNIPFALIGAIALSLYGFPRYTSDLDMLTDGNYQSDIVRIMKKLGYTCDQITDSFAQFGSESGVFGYVDFMFVSTKDGKEILKRCVTVNDRLFGNHPVIQPSDYIILKLMAIANNPDRSLKDEPDIWALLRLYKSDLIPEYFESLNKDRIYRFAERFRQKERMEKCFNAIFEKSDNEEFNL